MSEPYCGLDSKVPKGHHRGSMTECLEKKQVRYYGIKRIDERLIAHQKKTKKNKLSAEKLKQKVVVLGVRIKKLKEKFSKEKNMETKKTIIADLKVAVKELEDIRKQITNLKSSRKQSRLKSKSRSRSKN